MKEKMWIMDMDWKQTPLWLLGLFALIFFSFFGMFASAAYLPTNITLILLSVWLGGSFVAILVGFLFPYQYPRK